MDKALMDTLIGFAPILGSLAIFAVGWATYRLAIVTKKGVVASVELLFKLLETPKAMALLGTTLLVSGPSILAGSITALCNVDDPMSRILSSVGIGGGFALFVLSLVAYGNVKTFKK